MGKLTLLFVMVAVLGGSLLTFRTRMSSNETEYERRDMQGDILARDAATSGHGLVLNAMLGPTGFQTSLPFSEREVQNGRFMVDSYTTTPDQQQAMFSVTGHSGGATHTIRSTYEWDPMDFPGPVWMDVPYAVADIDPNTTIDGGSGAREAHFDDRRFYELQLQSILPWSDMAANLNGEFANANGNGGDFASSDMAASGLLEDVNVGDASDLYFEAIGAMGAADVTVAGPITYSGGGQNFGATSRIVRITGGLTIDNSTVQGVGMLIVEGPITMTGANPTLSWDGIVLVHSTDVYLPITMDGTAVVDIDGSLVIDHMAVPPGGHVDLTVMREDDGSWASPAGMPSPIWGPGFPWYQHKHKFDTDLPEGRTIYFAEEGADRHEEWTRFRDALAAQGTNEVYLEFVNESQHGYATYNLNVDVAGLPTATNGTVINGFGLFARSGDVHKTQNFRASDLNTFIVDVQSLRLLKKRWDGTDGCDVWPICIGESSSRRSALTLRIRRASNGRRVYEAAIYWHMRADEVAAHEAEEAALRASIESGTSFGTNLMLGENVNITYELAPIKALSERLGFDSDEMINTATATEHYSARDYRAAGVDAGVGGGPRGVETGHGSTAPPPPPPPGPPPDPLVIVCHIDFDLALTPVQAVAHLGHGDTVGGCGPPAPAGQMWICHRSPPSNTTMLIDMVAWPLHTGHGDWEGQCP